MPAPAMSDCRTKDVLVLGAVQCPLCANDQHPLEATVTAIHLMKQACHDQKMDLVVLPKLAPIGYSQDTFQRYLPNSRATQELYRKIHAQMVETCVELQVYVAYGTIGIIDNDEQKFTIWQLVIDSTGTTIDSYDKMLLCDYGDCAETRYFVAGTELVSFAIRNFRLGILLCADLRNPTYARSLVASTHHKVDVLLQTSAFSRDFSFHTWKSFRETRAVENSVYFCSVNYAGDKWGESSFVEPWVDKEHEPNALGCEVSVLVGQVKRATLNHVRTTIPHYKQLLKEEW